MYLILDGWTPTSIWICAGRLPPANFMVHHRSRNEIRDELGMVKVHQCPRRSGLHRFLCRINSSSGETWAEKTTHFATGLCCKGDRVKNTLLRNSINLFANYKFSSYQYDNMSIIINRYEQISIRKYAT